MFKKLSSMQLHWQILIALILAAIVGSFLNIDSALGGVSALGVFNFIGTLFINALKMLIVPLIVSSVIVGIAGIGSGGNLGRLGGRTLLFYAVTSLAAILVGLLLVNFIKPGIDSNGTPVQKELAIEKYAEQAKSKVGNRGSGDVVEIFLRMFPPNIVKAAADGQMLGLIVFSLLFGFYFV